MKKDKYIDPLHEMLEVEPTEEPKFIKLYFDDISKLYSLSKNFDFFVLRAL